MEDSIFYRCYGDEFVNLAEELLERSSSHRRCWCFCRHLHFAVYLIFLHMVDAGIIVVFIINVIQSKWEKIV